MKRPWKPEPVPTGALLSLHKLQNVWTQHPVFEPTSPVKAGSTLGIRLGCVVEDFVPILVAGRVLWLDSRHMRPA